MKRFSFESNPIHFHNKNIFFFKESRLHYFIEIVFRLKVSYGPSLSHPSWFLTTTHKKFIQPQVTQKKNRSDDNNNYAINIKRGSRMKRIKSEVEISKWNQKKWSFIERIFLFTCSTRHEFFFCFLFSTSFTSLYLFLTFLSRYQRRDILLTGLYRLIEMSQNDFFLLFLILLHLIRLFFIVCCLFSGVSFKKF